MNIKPEIMSPAGYWPQLQAAIEAGTDGDVQSAREFLTSALRVLPDDPQALCMLTLLLRSQDRQSDALRLLDRTLKQFPKHSWALALRGMIRQSEGKTEQALEDFAAVDVDVDTVERDDRSERLHEAPRRKHRDPCFPASKDVRGALAHCCDLTPRIH